MSPRALAHSLLQKAETNDQFLNLALDHALLSSKLSEQDRELLLDKIERQRSDDEIAQRLGITVNAVRIRWMRLKERIARILQNGFDPN